MTTINCPTRKFKSRKPKTSPSFCYSHYTRPFTFGRFFLVGLPGRCPSMNDHQPRVNAGQNYPIGNGGYHPTLRVGTERTLAINRTCITRHGRMFSVPQGRFTSGFTCDRVNAFGPRYGYSIKSLFPFTPSSVSKT